MRSARCCLPGSYLRPAEPTPATNPKEAPLRATHSLPFAPSLTNGIRSLNSRGASEVKRSGGNQIMSRWQSAEIRLYCIGFTPSGGPADNKLPDGLANGLEGGKGTPGGADEDHQGR